MKRKLVYIGLCIIFLLIGGYVFRYKRAFDFNNCIPNSAEHVVSINLRAIEEELLLDGIRHFSFFGDSDKKKDKKEKNKFSWFWDIDIPHNLVFHASKTRGNTFFSQAITINDVTKFKTYLISKYFNTSNSEFYTKDSFSIYIKENLFWIVIGKTSDENIVEYIHSILNQNSNNINTKYQFLERENPMIYVQTKGYELEGYLNTEGVFMHSVGRKGEFYPNEQLLEAIFDQNHIKALPEFAKRKIDKATHAIHYPSIKSFEENWNVTSVIKLESIDAAYNSVITFDFDEDFNRIEKKKIDTVVVPNVSWSWFGKTELLESQWDFLKTSNLVREQDHKWIFSAIPLLPFYAKKEDSLVTPTFFSSIYDDSQSQNNPKFSVEAEGDKPLYLHAKPNEISLKFETDRVLLRKLKRIKQVDLFWKPQDNNIRFQLLFQDTDQSILDQFK